MTWNPKSQVSNRSLVSRRGPGLLQLIAIAAGLLLPTIIAQPSPAQQPPLTPDIPEGTMLIQGDILVPQDFFAMRGTYASNTWTNAVIPYAFDANVSSSNRTKAIAAMGEWEFVAPVDFVARSSQSNYIVFRSSTGNNSYVGMIGGGQTVNIVSWDYRFIICHELGHAMGLWHEQSRTDRDNYIRIEWDNIQPGVEYNFDLEPTSGHYGPYDFDSVMHYDQCAFSNCCPPGFACACPSYCRTITVLPPYTAWQDFIGQIDHLSDGDAETITFLYRNISIDDCNTNGIDDALDIALDYSEDCNRNSVPDECDIRYGTSRDDNFNRVPDECDGPTVTSISPSSGENTAPIAISSVNGNNFQPGAGVRLTRGGQSDIPCSGFTYSSSTRLSNGSCNILGATPGLYNVVVTNPDARSGALTNGFNVVCSGSPSIISHPASLTRCTGEAAAFAVGANGAATLRYQWQRNNTDIAGATTSAYSINSVTAASAGNYRCIVTNNCGSATSNAAVLTIAAAPSVTSHPQSLTRCFGQSATFNVSVTGGGTYSYQWQKNAVNIPGATASSLTLNNVGAGDAGSYRVVVSNSCGSTTSNAATLTVAGGTLSITQHPQSATRCAGQAVTFSVVVQSDSPVTYQWQKNGQAVSGATGASLTLNNLGSADAGTYLAVASNACGSANSNSAGLTVNIPPTITTQPTGASVCVGQAVEFRIAASGTAPLSYQWQKDGLNIPGATAATYSISTPGLQSAGSYRAVVTNSCGTATSNAVTLTVAGGLDCNGNGIPDQCEGLSCGACCLPTGECLESTAQSECVAEGGTFRGANVECATISCPQPRGACCLPNGSCLEIAQADCALVTNGRWAGPLTTCAMVNGTRRCPLGACCLAVGGCTDNIVQAACENQPGVYQGPDSTCAAITCPAPQGACCLASGNCLRLTQADCGVLGGSTWAGGGSACANVGGNMRCPLGACCLPDGVCAAGLAPTTCTAQAGAHQGPGTNCGSVNCPQPVGACCLPNGSCLVLRSADCALAANSRWSANVTCADNDGSGRADVCESTPGDINGDGAANATDIPPFVSVLLGAPQAPEHVGRSDVNHDGAANGRDVVSFIAAIMGP